MTAILPSRPRLTCALVVAALGAGCGDGARSASSADSAAADADAATAAGDSSPAPSAAPSAVPSATASTPWSAARVLTPASAIETATRCTQTTPALTGPGGLGPVHVGMSLPALRAACPEAERAWLELEGTREPALLVGLGDVAALVELTDTAEAGVVSRIGATSPALRSPDGIGPGVPVRDALAAWPDLRIAHGEGTFLLSASHPGISLQITWDEVRDPAARARAATADDPSRLPDGARISRVLLVGAGP